MPYIINGARPHALLIGGTNYTSRLVNFTVSDSSAFKSGFVTTNGTLVLATVNDGTNLVDYERDMFKRGVVVTLDITYDDGTTVRHPRGYLYVLSVSYDIENEQIIIEVGCELTLRRLVNKVDDILTLAPITLDPERKTYEGISGSLATAAKYVYQNNAGTLVTTECFPNDIDNEFYVDNNVFESWRTVTTVDVNPLAQGPIPDKIKFTADEPTSGSNTDKQGTVETVTTTSNYFIKHPGPVFKQTRSCTEVEECLEDIKGSSSYDQTPAERDDQCGDDGTPPGFSKCEEMYTVVENQIYLPVTSVQVQKTTYGGPAAQVSKVETTTHKPTLELAPGYYSDQFYACWAKFGVACSPNGACQIGGLTNELAERRVQVNKFGDANEVIETVNETHSSTFSVVKPEDYRSGVVDGVPKVFATVTNNRTFLSQIQTVKNYTENNLQVQETVTKTSITSRGIGLSAGDDAIDASLNGIETKQIRKSDAVTLLNIAPDAINSSSTETEPKTVEIELDTPGKTGPTWHTEYIAEETGLVPFLIDNDTDREAAINKFGRYLKRWYEGDVKGISITEMLRKKIVTDWYPTRTFRYYDPSGSHYAAYRMDASSWEVTLAGCYVATDGIFMIEFTTNPTIEPDNVVGDATPNMNDGNPTPPPSPNPEPPNPNPSPKPKNQDIYCKLNLTFSTNALFGGVYKPPKASYTGDLNFVLKLYVTGIKSQVGALVLPTADGNLPVTQGGSLIVDGNKVIDADLFS
jgi:hypothetical protein